MEANSDGDDAEQIFYDTVREYVVSVNSFSLCYTIVCGNGRNMNTNKEAS